MTPWPLHNEPSLSRATSVALDSARRDICQGVRAGRLSSRPTPRDVRLVATCLESHRQWGQARLLPSIAEKDTVGLSFDRRWVGLGRWTGLARLVRGWVIFLGRYAVGGLRTVLSSGHGQTDNPSKTHVHQRRFQLFQFRNVGAFGSSSGWSLHSQWRSCFFPTQPSRSPISQQRPAQSGAAPEAPRHFPGSRVPVGWVV